MEESGFSLEVWSYVLSEVSSGVKMVPMDDVDTESWLEGSMVITFVSSVTGWRDMSDRIAAHELIISEAR